MDRGNLSNNVLVRAVDLEDGESQDSDDARDREAVVLTIDPAPYCSEDTGKGIESEAGVVDSIVVSTLAEAQESASRSEKRNRNYLSKQRNKVLKAIRAVKNPN